MYLNIYIIQKIYIKIQYENEFVQNFGVGDPKKLVYKFNNDEKGIVDTKIIKSFIVHGLVMWNICSMNGHSVIIQQFQ